MRLKHALAQQCHKVSLHTILIGVMGATYTFHTELPLGELGLDRCKVRKQVSKIMQTNRRLKINKFTSLQV